MRLGHVYDDQGLLARQGKTHTVWKQQLSQIEFFSQPLPKSISNEWTETKFLHAIPKGETVDLLYTYTQFIASEICGVLQEHSAGLVMITGGGAYNTFLIDSMKAMLPNNFFEVPQPELIEGKEALIFAFMALLRKQNKVNVLASATGANKDHCSGVVYFP
ncbi:MAG: anhydro-N-acetylmuramic acid kinase [Cyclobacteriaceae bacterium]|jgi:anhydro-N-acetylmuramic acid kinase